MAEKKKEIKNWNTFTITLLIIAGLLFVFSFFAPSLFVKASSNPNLDFSQTGPIGDTIGGIMNPFIALAGVLLTFLAFYMQIKANEIQRKQFFEGLQAERDKTIREEKLDAYYKLSLLTVDLQTILDDIEQRAQRIKTYFEKEREFPFNANILTRTATRKYLRILEIDRLNIYKGFKFFLSHDEKWLKGFNNMYSTLDYLPEFFEEVYKLYDYHSKEQFQERIDVRNKLTDFINKGSKLLTEYKMTKNAKEYLKLPASSLVNETIHRYHEILNKSYDEDGNSITETDLSEISNDVLKFFLKQALAQRDNPKTFDRKLEDLMENASDLRKHINFIKEKSLEFSKNIEVQYNTIKVDSEGTKSTITVLTEIKDFVKGELDKLNTNNF